MVKRGLREREESWLGAVKPIWLCLDVPSYCRLRHRPGEDDLAMRLSRGLTAAEAARSPVVVGMLHLLRAASEGRAKLTASDNLSRALVTALAGIVDGPAFDHQIIGH